jgi:hypothetical protein
MIFVEGLFGAVHLERLQAGRDAGSKEETAIDADALKAPPFMLRIRPTIAASTSIYR